MDKEITAKWMRNLAIQHTAPMLTKKQLIRHHEQLIATYFHAGRYAAGDRDQTATDAYATFERIENANS